MGENVKVVFKEDLDRIDEKVRSIRLCLEQLEEEARECGCEFSALLIRAAAMSFTCKNGNLE